MASVPHPSAAVLLTSAFSQRARPLPTHHPLPLVESTTPIAPYTFCNYTAFVRWTRPVILTRPLALTPAPPSTQRPPFAPGAPRRLCLAMSKQSANMTILSFLTRRLRNTGRVAKTLPVPLAPRVMSTTCARMTRSVRRWVQAGLQRRGGHRLGPGSETRRALPNRSAKPVAGPRQQG